MLFRSFSLMTLRSSLRVQGTLAEPQVQVFNTSTWARALGAAALLTVHPLAGILPLIDPGQREQARQLDARCHA